MIRLNCNEKLNITETILKIWQARSLMLQGKIVIIKSLVIPHLLQFGQAILVSEKFLINQNRISISFVWNDRKHLTSKNVLLQPIGGHSDEEVTHLLLTSEVGGSNPGVT